MGYIDTGLTDLGSGRGKTAHYAFVYDDALDSTAHPGQPEPARTNALMASAETDFNLMDGWFGGIALPYGLPISIQVANAGGGASWGPPITLDPDGGDANLMRYLMVAEVTEMLMLAQGAGWFAPDGSNEQSSGEGLSHFLATQFLLANGLAPFNAISNLWLNSSRDDFINHIDEYDHSSGPKSACALLFLYYLNVQLGFSIAAIVAAASAELSGVYNTLTGDGGDPFPFFKHLLDAAFPAMSTITAGPNFDNPYPLGLLSFWVDKSSFGRDEVQDAIATSGGLFPNAFWLVVEGFSMTSFNALGVTIPAPTGSFAAIPGIQITRSTTTPVDFEDPAHPNAPQRIRIAFDIRFTDPLLTGFPAAGAGPTGRELDAFLSIGGSRLGGSDASTIFELDAGADPYFTNVDPAQNNVFWLSQDLRVFTATPGQHPVPVAGGPTFGPDTPAGAFAYVQQLLTHLNANFSNPAGADPFATILPSQAGALTGDSSVTPFSVDFSTFPPAVHANYNFAIARVRLRGSATPTNDVRVFFRLWSTETADTDYDVASTYPSSTDALGLPSAPLVGPSHHTLPFFASGNLAGSIDYAAGGPNIQSILIPAGQHSIWAYYGCFLNLYDPGNVIDGQPIQHWLNGTHHCIVAQVAYDGAPILNLNGISASPERSDKLAQRNLQITHSDNPGGPATHRIPQTFDVRPSRQFVPVSGEISDYPDELMIDWGNIPSGSTASIYWPAVDAAEVLRLASEIHGTHLLGTADPHTVTCAIEKSVTYVPIPPGSGENFAGLLTVDLPVGVTSGQVFDVVVRRVTSRRLEVDRPRIAKVVEARASADPAVPKVDTVLALEASGQVQTRIDLLEEKPPDLKSLKKDAVPRKGPSNWRYVVGTFGVRIPVVTKDVMLPPELDTLAIMKWRLASLAPIDRWHPVLVRYVEYLSARVDGLGGDAGAVKPSMLGIAHGRPTGGERRQVRTGKVAGLIYDRFGDFDGFILETSEAEITFKARELEMEAVILRAWADRTLVDVVVEEDEPHRPAAIILRAPPPPTP